MTDHSHFFNAAWLDALGWTLLHSLWQGAAIAILLGIALLLFRKKSANSRYLFGVFALSGLIICMVLTFNFVYAPPLEIEPSFTPEPPTEFAMNQLENEPAEIVPSEPGKDEFTFKSIFINYFETHMPLIMLLYLIGVLILTMRMLGELVYIQNLRYKGSHFAGEEWQQKLRELAQKMGVKTSVSLKESLKVNSPLIIGFLKPIIFLPIGLLANMPSNQIESILAHELAHIRRHDYLINLLQSFVEILLFFNPSVWWISSFIRSEREHCCDDLAIKITGDELAFVKTLANLEEWRIQNNRLAVAFAGNRSSGVLKRVQRLIEKEESFQLPFRFFWGATILAIGFLFTAFNMENATATKNDFVQHDDNFTESTYTPIETNESIISSENEIIAETSNILTENNPALPANYEQLVESEVQNYISASNDTIPDNIKNMEKEMSEMEREFRMAREELIKEMKEIESKRHAIERAVQMQEHELQSVQLAMEREIQNIEKERMLLERELDLQQNSQEEIILDLQYQMQELELQLELAQNEMENNENDEKIEKEIEEKRRQLQELRKKILLQEKEIARKELEVKKQAILKEKEAQEKMYNSQSLEHENQMAAHSKEANILQLEEASQLIEIRLEELENQFQNQFYKIQQKIESEYEKIDREEY